MSDTRGSLPKIRTFAQDLEQNRPAGSSAVSKDTTSSATTPPKQTPTPKRQPAPPIPKAKKHHPAHTPAKKTEHIEADPVTIKENPPYHALKKRTPTPAQIDVGEIDAKILEDRPASVLSSKTKDVSLTDDGDDFGATIISDTKHKRFRLSSALVSSIADWWGSLKAEYLEKQKPKYTVPIAERRKGVIQQATSQTGRISTADHNAVVERIRAKKQAAAHVETDPAHLLEAPDDQPVRTSIQNVTIKPRKTAANRAQAEREVSPELPPASKPKPEPVEPTIPPVPAPVVPRIVPTPPPAPVAPAPAAVPAITPTIPAPVPALSQAAPASTAPPRRAPRLPQPGSRYARMSRYLGDTNTMTLAIVGGLVCLVTAYIGVSALIGLVFTPDDGVGAYQPEAIFADSVQLNSVQEPSIQQIATLLRDASMQYDEPILELSIVDSTGKEALPAREVFEILPTELPTAFLESIEQVVWGSYRGNWFMVLSVSDTTTARGALLSWERTLVRDLSPLTSTLSNVRFTDDTIEDTDVRTARTEDGTEVVVHGFLQDSLVLITQNTTAFVNLRQALTSP